MNIDTSKGSPEMDYEAHFQTYRDFIRFAKYSVAFVVVVLVLMKIFLF